MNQFDDEYKENVLNKIKEKHLDLDFSEFEYISSRTPGKVICPKHGEFYQNAELLLKETNHKRISSKHSGCPKCARIKIIKDQLEEYNLKYDLNYTYPEDLDVLKHEKFIAICPEHGEFETSLRKLEKGTKCLKCSIKIVASKQQDTLETFIEKANKTHNNKYDYSKTNYIKSNKKVDIICPEHGLFQQKPYHHIGGQGCVKCSSWTSKHENDIFNILRKISNDFEQKNRKLIYPKELDIVNDKHKFAIEYNGLFFHSDYYKHKNYHLEKTIKTEEKGYQLFHIFENEYLDQVKKDIWLSVIKDKLQLNKKIGARKTVVKEVPVKEAKEFQEQNHLQGYGTASIKLGLYYTENNKEELISLMTFGKSRFNKNYQYELIRFCTKKGLTVQGGASKLLKYFEKNYNPESLISYANRRWSIGNLYKKLGFDYSHASEPGFFYFNTPEKLYSRNNFQKHKLKDKLKEYDPELTAEENMKNNGYNKIYDSGNLVFIKKY